MIRMNPQTMKYKITIDEPWTHYVKISGEFDGSELGDNIRLFLPIWSPGSYMVREYSRHLRKLRVLQENGEFIYFEKVSKNIWELDLNASDLKKRTSKISFEYEVYCNEVSVRTSHVNLDHAFLHGPSLFLGVEGKERDEIELEIKFPPCWSKVNTSLEDISPQRQIFLYRADNFDEFIDSPIEIGNQETDGFRVHGKDHFLVWMGLPLKVYGNLKKDLKEIVERVADYWGELPYERYVFMGHFLPNTYGGLEHLSSTAVQFDPIELGTEKGYRDFLGLLAHEFFHTWNVKRVRPIELGPFKYSEENYTRMHWLTEGLTSFVDDLIVFNSGLSDQDYFLEVLKKKINNYLKTPGRYFDSLEEASFDAWIKLYRPDENSKNSSVSYYLKGSLAFFCLNSLLHLQGRKLHEFTDLLWDRYKSDPDKGVDKDEVLSFIAQLAGQNVADEFESYLSQTGALPLEEAAKRQGLEFKWHQPEDLDWGFEWKVKGENLFVEKVRLDGPAHKCGLNHGDEILAVAGMRLNKSNYKQWEKTLKKDETLELLISRFGKLLKIDTTVSQMPREIEKITIADSKEFSQALTILK